MLFSQKSMKPVSKTNMDFQEGMMKKGQMVVFFLAIIMVLLMILNYLAMRDSNINVTNRSYFSLTNFPPASGYVSKHILSADDRPAVPDNSRPDTLYPDKGYYARMLHPPPTTICPRIPPDLIGWKKPSQELLSWEQLERIHELILPGGRYHPTDCISRHKVAIIIPQRNRETQLRILLHHLHPILRRQQLDYKIYVAHQSNGTMFNKAMLYNVAVKEVLKDRDWDCLVFHDVDMLTEDDRNLYSCSELPKHMSVGVNEFNYSIPYGEIFGGVISLTSEHIQQINGFSNQFWGWGGEDDDIYNRVANQNLSIIRHDPKIARYTMIKHDKETPNEARWKNLHDAQYRFDTDGLNNVRYEIVRFSAEPLYTNITAAFGEVAPLNGWDVPVEYVEPTTWHPDVADVAPPTPFPPYVEPTWHREDDVAPATTTTLPPGDSFLELMKKVVNKADSILNDES